MSSSFQHQQKDLPPLVLKSTTGEIWKSIHYSLGQNNSLGTHLSFCLMSLYFLLSQQCSKRNDSGPRPNDAVDLVHTGLSNSLEILAPSQARPIWKWRELPMKYSKTSSKFSHLWCGFQMPFWAWASSYFSLPRPVQGEQNLLATQTLGSLESVIRNTIIMMQCLLCVRTLKSLQRCPTLCDPMDCSPPGSSVRGIL